MAANIFSEVSCLQNVGEKRKRQYNKLGIFTVCDLLWHLPRGYIDFASAKGISELELGQFGALRAVVLKKSALRLRVNLTIYSLLAESFGQKLNIKIFNSFYAFNQIKEGQEYVFFGKATRLGLRPELSFVDFIPATKEPRMRPVYRLTSGLSSKVVAKNVAQALGFLKQMPEFLPKEICRELNLSTFEYAMKNIHFPKNKEALGVAGHRLALDELILFNLGFLKQKMQKLPPVCKAVVGAKVQLDEFFKAAEFEPTKAQIRVINEILEGLKQENSSNRLVQGDVGCGKTFVAAAAIFAACKSGLQAALIAPTELLAQQHYEYLKNLLGKLKIKVGLLCGGMPAKQKKQVAKSAAEGELDCVVGTHALLSDSLEFLNLGLVITDEQHKFGVKQREKLSGKGQSPNVIVMSATPIPRTLAMLVYCDLEISVIDEMPKSRRPIKTCAVNSSYRNKAYSFIKKELQKGHQCYIVCPLVGEENYLLDNEDEQSRADMKAVVSYSEELKKGPLAGYAVGFVHGKQTAEQKEQVMQEFKSGQIQVLISTTVVEVGLDQPNATVMLIENADRFGLAQLHQLRGRVGRGVAQSYCILLSDANTPKVKERLDFVAGHTSGFEIAEYDLKSRGPGEFLGTKQHGAFGFKLAEYITGLEYMTKAKKIAKEILRQDPELNLERNAYFKGYIKEKLVLS